MARQRQTKSATSAAATKGTKTKHRAGARHQTSAIAPASRQMMDVNVIEFSCHTNAIYHSARRGFLDFMHRLIMFVVLVSGSAATVAFMRSWPSAAVALTLVPVFASAIDLVAGFSSRARDHEFLARRYWRLLADTRDGGDLAQLNKDIHGIYADEPPQFRALYSLSENQAMDMIGIDAENFYVVPWRQRIFKNLWAFPGARYSTAKEVIASN